MKTLYFKTGTIIRQCIVGSLNAKPSKVLMVRLSVELLNRISQMKICPLWVYILNYIGLIRSILPRNLSADLLYTMCT
jgi:hypothetical protein